MEGQIAQVYGRDPAGGEKRLEGIGGWLILMSIGQVLGPIQILSGMVQEYASLPDGTVAAYPAAMFGDVVLRLGFVGFLVYTAFLFFNKRAEFPKMFIYSYVATLILPFAIGIWVTVTSGINTLSNLAGGEFIWTYALGAAIGAAWVSYVLNSERVKNTFVM